MTKTTKTTQTATNQPGVECWIRGNHGNHENDENHGNPGCKPRVPQTTGLEIPDFLVVFPSGNPPKIATSFSVMMGKADLN